MKKLFFFAAACAALAGCAKNESPAPNVNDTSDAKISFATPVVAPTTRVYGELTAYPTDETFVVQGKWYEGDYTKYADGVVYMGNATNGVVVAHNTAYNDSTDGTGGWSNANVTNGKEYYWPKQGKLTFQAYSPAAVSAVAAFGANGVTFTNYTVPAVGSQYDVMYSDRAYNKTKSTEGSNTTYDGVDIKFKHALASVVFNAKTSEAYTGTTIQITAITLNNVYTTGNFAQNLTDGNESTTETNPGWTHTGSQNGSYTGILDAVETLNATGVNDFCNDLLVMPQEFAANTQIVIDYTISSGDGTAIAQKFTATLNQYKYNNGTSDVALTGFEMGKRYTFNIVVALDKIYFAPEVTAWTDITVKDDIK